MIWRRAVQRWLDARSVSLGVRGRTRTILTRFPNVVLYRPRTCVVFGLVCVPRFPCNLFFTALVHRVAARSVKLAESIAERYTGHMWRQDWKNE